jgi:hypothetical protein
MKVENVSGNSKYGESTVVMRVPLSMVPEFKRMLSEREVLQTQWVNSYLPPAALKLVEHLTEHMLFPQKSLIKSFLASGVPELVKQAKTTLTRDLDDQRAKYSEYNVTSLLDVIRGEVVVDS